MPVHAEAPLYVVTIAQTMMQGRQRKGRDPAVFGHITVGTTDLDRSAKFYDAVLPILGFVRQTVTPDGGPSAVCRVQPDQALPRFRVERLR